MASQKKLARNTRIHPPNLARRILTTVVTSIVLVFYMHLRWGISLFVGMGVFVVGCLALYFTSGYLISFVREGLHSEGREKAYTIKSIVYMIAMWGIVLACRPSYWRFEAQHEISICPGWSNDVEESSYPILVKVINRGTNTVIPNSEFREASGGQFWAVEGEQLEIRDCVYYHYTDTGELKQVSFEFISGEEYLPVQVTANNVGAVLDLGDSDEARAGHILTPTSVYNPTWMTLLQYVVRWILLLWLAVVCAACSLFAIQRLLSVMERFLKRTLPSAFTGLTAIQSGVIAVWLVWKMGFEGYLSGVIWLLLMIVGAIGLNFLSDWIIPAEETSQTQGKVILFAFLTSIVLSLFIPLQPNGMFGNISLDGTTNYLYHTRLLGKIALVDLFLLVAFSLLTGTHKVYRPKPILARWWLLVYAAPMMAVGFVMLLAFYPGIMSQDSLSQWIQIARFKFEPWHPIFHTLLNWLVTRVWMSPAAVAIAQIVGVSLTVGYGLYRLEKVGLPKFVISAAAVIAACVPPNGFFMVTLWKDIPYAIVYMWLTIFMFEIYYSNGQWLAEHKNMILLGVVIASATLIRYNGVMEMAVLVILLILVMRTQWRRWLLASGIALTLFLTVNIAIDRYLMEPTTPREKSTTGALPRIIEHRIRAHIFSGNEIQQHERDLLFKTMPSLVMLDDYNCHNSSLPLMFSYYTMLFDPQKSSYLLRSNLALISRAPWVEINHQICNLSILWRVYPRMDESKYLIPIKVRSSSGDLIYHTPPEYAALAGVVQDSKLPRLATILAEYVSVMIKDKSLRVAPWRAALYVYVIIIGVIFRGLVYEKSWKIFIVAGPVLVHLAVFTFGNVFDDFRFHYMIVLIACILWPLLFLRGSIPGLTGE